jgi:hypothetical protein
MHRLQDWVNNSMLDNHSQAGGQAELHTGDHFTDNNNNMGHEGSGVPWPTSYNRGQDTNANMQDTGLGSSYFLQDFDSTHYAPPLYRNCTEYPDLSDAITQEQRQVGTQYEVDIEQFRHFAVQCDGTGMRDTDVQTDTVMVQRNSVGTSCHLSPGHKSRGSQIKHSTVSCGISAVPASTNTISQTDISGDIHAEKMDTQDESTMCWQSPGSVDRHCQTFHIKTASHSTNTKALNTETVAVETCSLTIPATNASQTDLLDPIPLYDTNDKMQYESTSYKLHPPERKQTISDILTSAGMQTVTRQDYANLVHDPSRNGAIRHIIHRSHVTGGTCEKYFCVFYDFIIPISELELHSDGHLFVYRYIKLYEGYEQHIFSNSEATFILNCH